MLTHGLQWVWIEELTTVDADTADNTVVERALQCVVVFRFAMQEEQSVVEIHLSNGSTSFAISRHVWQFVVLTKCLTTARGTHTTRDVVFLRDDVVPNPVDGIDIALVACQCSHVCHTCIHVAGTNGMTYGFILLQYRKMTLAVLRLDGSVATLVEEEFGLVEILLLARSKIEFRKSHLGNLVSWHYACLSWLVAHFAHHAVCELAGDVEQRLLARGIVVSHSSLAEVSEIVELMAQVLYLRPSLWTSPSVWVLWVLCASRVEITVRLLCTANHGNHTVNVSLEFLVRVSLEQITCTFNRLVRVGIVE